MRWDDGCLLNDRTGVDAVDWFVENRKDDGAPGLRRTEVEGTRGNYSNGRERRLREPSRAEGTW